jgi:hypothetical protein
MKNLFRADFREKKAIVSGLEIELGVIPSKSHGYIAISPEDIVGRRCFPLTLVDPQGTIIILVLLKIIFHRLGLTAPYFTFL